MAAALLITKTDRWSKMAASLARDAFGDISAVSAKPSESLPEDIYWWQGDVLISFLCPWVLPKAVLERFALAINFHPASSEYPGIGCYNFAIYEGAATYGAVCHHMAAQVDSGPIVEERRFPLFPGDTVASLKNRTMAVMLGMFAELVTALAAGRPLPKTDVQWKRPAFTRRDLEALCVITPDMTAEEIKRRVRATDFTGYPGATITLGGMTFAYKNVSGGQG